MSEVLSSLIHRCVLSVRAAKMSAPDAQKANLQANQKVISGHLEYRICLILQFLLAV